MIYPLLTLTRNTFLESIRQPVYTVLVLAGCLGMVLMPSLSAYTMEDDDRFLLELGVSWVFMAGVLLAAFTATGVLTREIDNRTVLAVLSKPVARPLFILGKFLGVALAMAMAVWTVSMVLLLAVRHGVMSTAAHTIDWVVVLFGLGAAMVGLLVAAWGNYMYQWVFTSTLMRLLAVGLTVAVGLTLFVADGFEFQSPLVEFSAAGMMREGQVPIALAMVLLALVFLTAVAIAASTRLTQVMTLSVTLGVVVIGVIHHHLTGAAAAEAGEFGWLVYGLPNLQLLWPGEALVQEQTITAGYLAGAAAYAACLTAAALTLAIALFQQRELG